MSRPENTSRTPSSTPEVDRHDGDPDAHAGAFAAVADIADFVSGDGIDSIVALTQAAYDLLDPVVATTLYVIVEA